MFGYLLFVLCVLMLNQAGHPELLVVKLQSNQALLS